MRLDSVSATTAVFVLVAALGSVPAAAAGFLSYELAADSTYQQGCFPPCHCPITAEVPVRGTFVIDPAVTEGDLTSFEVREVSWAFDLAGKPVVVTGAGSYRSAGGDLPSHQLVLDLSIDGTPQRFDSGPIAGRGAFPEIVATLSTSQMVCYDRVLRLHAVPAAGSGRAAFVLTASTSSLGLILVTGGTTSALAGSVRLHFSASDQTATEAWEEVAVTVDSVEFFATGFDPILPGVGATKHLYQDPDQVGRGAWNPMTGAIAFDLALVAAEGGMPMPLPLQLSGQLDRDGLRVAGSNGEVPDAMVVLSLEAEQLRPVAEARRHPIAGD